MGLAAVFAFKVQAQPLPQAVPAGQGRLTFFGLAVYDARLSVAPGFRHSEFDRHGLQLELAYLRAFSAADIAKRSLDEMRRGGTLDAAQAQRWQALLAQLLPDVQPGDRLLGVHRPGRGAQFLHNGKLLGEVDDAEFSRRFFAVWLAPATSEPGLRQALLAGTEP